MKIEVTEYKETNKFADVAKQNHGGGYHQPLIKGSVGNSIFRLRNTQCAEFGSRAEIKIDEYEAAYDFISVNNQEWSKIPDSYKEEVRAINERFHTFFLVESQITKGWT